MQSIHDQQQNINSSSRSLQTKVKMANCIFGYQVKVQLTPQIFFRLYKSPCFSDHRCEKIIVVAILANFL